MEHGTCSSLFPGRMYGDAAGCFGLHSDCSGMSGLVSTCRHSHLSYGKRLQCRLDRTKTRRLRMRTQRQLLAVIFLCGMSSAHAMQGQAEQSTIQEAFLQRMTSMAEAATRAAMAAEEALKKASIPGGAK